MVNESPFIMNLFDAIPDAVPEELFTTLHNAQGLRIERIVSQGQSSPPGFWYDQKDHEWVLVLAGSATLEFADRSEPVQLQRGSYLHIPAHARHRVVWTHPIEKTIWLAIYYTE